MLSLDKLLCKIPQWCTAFIMFMNGHANFTWFILKVTSYVRPSMSGPLYCNKVQLSIMGNTSCCNPTFFVEFPHSTTMCMLPWSLCGWQGIWWHLDVHTNMPRLPLIIIYVLLACRSFLVSSPLIQSFLGCDQIFWFTPWAPHHNHPDCLHPTMGTHLLCLESITHPTFNLGQKVLSAFFHPWCKPHLLLQPILRKSVPPWNFLPQVCHFRGPMHLVLLWIKDIKPLHKFVATSKILHSNHSKNSSEFQSLMYCKEPSSSTKNLCSMTCIYFSTPIPCLLIKAPSRYAIVCSIKIIKRNVITIYWNCDVVICLGSLFSNFEHFQDYVNEVLSLLDNFATLHLCMVEGGPLKGLRG